MNIKQILTITLLSLPIVSHAEVYLYMFLHDDSTAGERFRTKMPDLKTCYEAVNNAKFAHPSTTGNDYEVMSVMWCGGSIERGYNAHWYKDKEEDLNK